MRCRYNAVNFLQIPHNRHPKSSPSRARYVVNTNSDLSSASVSGALNAILCCIRLRYNDTALYSIYKHRHIVCLSPGWTYRNDTTGRLSLLLIFSSGGSNIHIRTPYPKQRQWPDCSLTVPVCKSWVIQLSSATVLCPQTNYYWNLIQFSYVLYNMLFWTSPMITRSDGWVMSIIVVWTKLRYTRHVHQLASQHSLTYWYGEVVTLVSLRI